MADTLLTAKPSQDEVKAEKERQRLHDIPDILCQAILESRQSSSISRRRAIDDIISITTSAMISESIGKRSAERLAGKYIFAVQACDTPEGRDRGRPSGLVRLIIEGHSHLARQGFLTSDSRQGKPQSFERQAELLTEYGIGQKASTIKDWVYSRQDTTK